MKKFPHEPRGDEFYSPGAWRVLALLIPYIKASNAKNIPICGALILPNNWFLSPLQTQSRHFAGHYYLLNSCVVRQIYLHPLDNIDFLD